MNWLQLERLSRATNQTSQTLQVQLQRVWLRASAAGSSWILYVGSVGAGHDGGKGGQHAVGYLSDVLMRVFPPELIILIVEAHQWQHTPGEQAVCVLLHVLPCGRQGQSMRKVLQSQVQHSWGKPFTLHTHMRGLYARQASSNE